MKCNKIVQDAIDSIAIKFDYKLDRVLGNLPGTQKFGAEQLEGYLKKQGVSPKEISASGILNSGKGVKTISEWKAGNPSNQKLNSKDLGVNHSEITLGREGISNPSYKESGDIIQGQLDVETAHYRDKIQEGENIAGHKRTHIATVNNKKTMVLDEFQSDWAQSERAGRGQFKSNKDKTTKTDDKIVKLNAENRELTTELIDTLHRDKSLNGIGQAEKLQAIEEAGLTKELDNLLDEHLMNYGIDDISNLDEVPDFPMSPVKYQQYQIVQTLDEAIQQGIKRVAIPIKREGELLGSAGVTKFYDNLNKKILPEIRKKLEKQGMRIEVSKEGFKGKDTKNYLDETIDNDNTLHILEIVEIPNKQVKWDVYALLGTLGLTNERNKDEM